jgi:hypothetical protein
MEYNYGQIYLMHLTGIVIYAQIWITTSSLMAYVQDNGICSLMSYVSTDKGVVIEIYILTICSTDNRNAINEHCDIYVLLTIEI